MPLANKIKLAGHATLVEDGETFLQPDDFVVKGKKVWYVSCVKVTIRSNSNLDAVLRIWVEAGCPKVLSVGSFG